MKKEKSNLFTFKDASSFIEECINLSNGLDKSINKIRKLSLPDPTKDFIRQKKYLFAQQLLHLFTKRSKFIIRCLDIIKEDLEILRILFRGLLEAYCQMIYINLRKESDEEKIKKIIWYELCTAVLVRENQSFKLEIIDFNYRILQGMGLKPDEDFPQFNDLTRIIRDKIYNFNTKDFNRWNSKFKFNSPRFIIKNYFNERENPPVTKATMNYYYSVLSEQVHINPYFEALNGPINPKYQLIGILIILYPKFLLEITKLTNDSQDKKAIQDLFKDWRKNFAASFQLLWALDRKSKKPKSPSFSTG